MAIITIKNYDGEIVADINNKEILNDIISVSLIGRGAEEYIEDFNKNFIVLLENSANDSAPNNPVIGQFWYDTRNKQLKVFDGQNWILNVERINGKTLDEIKNWVLSFIDLSDKFDKKGGTFTGDITIKGELTISGNLYPTGNQTVSLGDYNHRFATLYIKDGSIFLGENKKYHITKNSFIYTVDSNESDVSKIPTGVIILNKQSGQAVIKKSNGKFGRHNSKFGQLLYDINNAIKLGQKVTNFFGDKAVHSRGWHCGWGPNQFLYIQISTPMNTRYFSRPRQMSLSPLGVTGGSRGLWHTGGWPGWQWGSSFEYITFSTPANSNYFGNANYRSVEGQGVSNGVKGVFSGGWNGWWGARSDIEYVTITTPSNSRYFGRTWQGRKYSNTHISDGTRGVNGGGHVHWCWWGRLDSIDYFTISTPSNGSRFGNLNWRRWCNTGNSNGTKGFFFGGWWNPRGSIEVVSISNPGNASYFGNTGLYAAHAASASNGITITVAGGWGYGWCWIRQIRRFNTQSPNNASYFGNLDYHLHHYDATAGN